MSQWNQLDISIFTIKRRIQIHQTFKTFGSINNKYEANILHTNNRLNKAEKEFTFARHLQITTAASREEIMRKPLSGRG